MAVRRLARRQFLGLGIAVSSVALISLDPLRSVLRRSGVVVYRRSCRGLRASRAAKQHAANRLYRTREAAVADRAHPGDPARVVRVTIGRERYSRLFGNGRTIVDLRRFDGRDPGRTT